LKNEKENAMAGSLTSEDRIELAKKCLRLIGRIAERCARSQNPEIIGYALQELGNSGFVVGPQLAPRAAWDNFEDARS
jgi:hypothetical protein